MLPRPSLREPAWSLINPDSLWISISQEPFRRSSYPHWPHWYPELRAEFSLRKGKWLCSSRLGSCSAQYTRRTSLRLSLPCKRALYPRADEKCSAISRLQTTTWLFFEFCRSPATTVSSFFTSVVPRTHHSLERCVLRALIWDCKCPV